MDAETVYFWLWIIVLSTHSDQLVGVVHHSDEHVEENHQWDDVVGAEHGGSNKLSKLMPSLHIGYIKIQ